MDCLHSHSLPQTHPPIRSPISVFPQLSHFPEPRQRRLLPALPWCCVALGRLEQPLIADACLERLRLRTWEKPAERWCSLCAHTHRACVRVCLCVCMWDRGQEQGFLLQWLEGGCGLPTTLPDPPTDPPTSSGGCPAWTRSSEDAQTNTRKGSVFQVLFFHPVEPWPKSHDPWPEMEGQIPDAGWWRLLYQEFQAARKSPTCRTCSSAYVSPFLLAPYMCNNIFCPTAASQPVKAFEYLV